MVTGLQAVGEPGSDLAGAPEGTPLTGYDLARLLAFGSNAQGILIFKVHSGCPRKKIGLLVRLLLGHFFFPLDICRARCFTRGIRPTVSSSQSKASSI